MIWQRRALAVIRSALSVYSKVVKGMVYGLAVAAGAGVLAMVGVTVTDVVLRAFGHPLVGAFDIVRMAGAITLACSLPYTTAVKGHVAIEYFFLKLPRAGRVIVDTLARLLVMALLALLAWQCVAYGNSLRHSGQVSSTLQVPVFWVPYVMALSCVVVVLVVFHNLLHPGKEMIKP